MMMTNEAANEPAIVAALPLAIAFVLLTCSQSKMDRVQCELCIMNNHNKMYYTTCILNFIFAKLYFQVYHELIDFLFQIKLLAGMRTSVSIILYL